MCVLAAGYDKEITFLYVFCSLTEVLCNLRFTLQCRL